MPCRNATICRRTPVSSQKSAANCTNSRRLSTSTLRLSPPGHNGAPPEPVSTKDAASAKTENGAAATGSSPGGCMYFRLQSGSAANSSRPPAPPRSASVTIFAQAPTNSPTTPSPGWGKAMDQSMRPPRSDWKKPGVNGKGTTNPSRIALAIKRPNMVKRCSTSPKLGESGGNGRTSSPRRGVRNSSFKEDSSSTHNGTSRFVERRCNS
mmetsp:Transcript_95116/g.274972  ORF Transcript_95116/g.274972 Transcript_95116/m.274972 type:complete len:209 (-) Transcript_95116:53-679(-)